MHRARLCVIVIGACETAKWRGNRVVKVTHTSNFVKPVHGSFRCVDFRKQPSLIAHSTLEPLDEMPVIDEIARLAERVCTCRQIETWHDCRETPHRRGGRIAEFSGHLQDQIPAHGKAGSENFAQ
jgi:hypothetical protein